MTSQMNIQNVATEAAKTIAQYLDCMPSHSIGSLGYEWSINQHGRNSMIEELAADIGASLHETRNSPAGERVRRASLRGVLSLEKLLPNGSSIYSAHEILEGLIFATVAGNSV